MSSVKCFQSMKNISQKILNIFKIVQLHVFNFFPKITEFPLSKTHIYRELPHRDSGKVLTGFRPFARVIEVTCRGSIGCPSNAIKRSVWPSMKSVTGHAPAPPALAMRNLWRRPGITVNVFRGTVGPLGWRPLPLIRRIAGFTWPWLSDTSGECCQWVTRTTWLGSSMS